MEICIGIPNLIEIGLFRLRYEDKAIFKMAAVRHLEFVKIAIFVNCPISACDSSSPFRNLHKSENMAPLYSQKTVLNMASHRHLEFEIFRFYVKFSCSGWKFVYVYQI